ncbi:Leucine-rich repeat serine/threonine-protein kinase 1, partial [Hondaea fermentalgiana]
VKEKAGEPDEEISFTIWDYGGQEVFYALHHLFLTQYGVYVLVFDMRELLGKEHFEDILEEEEVEKLDSQEEALETLCFWIDSIRLHAPNVKIAIVGTYLDEVPSLEQHKEIDQILRTKVLNKKHGGLSTVIGNTTGKGKKKTTLYFFPIDNMDRQDADERVSRLRVALSA